MSSEEEDKYIAESYSRGELSGVLDNVSKKKAFEFAHSELENTTWECDEVRIYRQEFHKDKILIKWG